MDISVTNMTSICAIIISLYVILKKDNGKLGSMETKIDMLLLNSSETKNDVKEHTKQIAQHDIEIRNVKTDVSSIQDTLRIKKIIREQEEFKR